MNTTDESHEEDAPNSSSLNHLPDEIILQILNKLLDLKTLCFCHLVSKRISSITLQVDSISYVAPLITPPGSSSASDPNTSGWDTTGSPKNLFQSFINGVVFKPIHLLRRMLVPVPVPYTKPLPVIISSFYGDSFRSAISFLTKFRTVKTLSIELPCSNHKGVDNTCLFKWKVTFGNRIESFLFLSPNVLSSHNDVEEEEQEVIMMDSMEPSVDSFKRKVHIAFQCLKDVIVRHRMLLYFVNNFPNLEKVAISDSGRRGTLSLSGGRLDEVRGWVCSGEDVNRIEVPVNVSKCYVPVLELPVLGGVMKGVTLVVMQMDCDKDGFMESVCEGGFEDEVEVAYTEGVREVLMNHRDKMKRLL